MRTLIRVVFIVFCLGQVLLMVEITQAAEKAMSKSLCSDSGFTAATCAWQPTAVRDEVRPECAVDEAISRTGAGGSLRARCTAPQQYGGWTRTINGLTGGKWYRFEAYYRAQDITDEIRLVVARLDWQREGERVGQPDYVYHLENAGGGWKRVWSEAPAPAEATSVRIELFMGWCPGGTVWWDDITFTSIATPAPRTVRVATVHHQPRRNHSAAENIEEFCAWIDKAATSKPDIICLPEAMTAVGTGLSYAEVAEPIPGPTSKRLGEKAKEHHCYLVACYNERDGAFVYNTAVLIDRQGKLVGKYRKVYVPREEIEAGITPGRDYPVFDTDFGKVGMMICWDVEYTKPAQRLALKGAELILMPIWGGDDILMKARAVENHLYLVTSTYGETSWIIDPVGRILAEARTPGKGFAVAEINLNERTYYNDWLGDMRARFIKEHREDAR